MYSMYVDALNNTPSYTRVSLYVIHPLTWEHALHGEPLLDTQFLWT